MKSAAITALAVLALACTVEAQYTEVNITSQVNDDIQTYTDGGNYQLGGTQLYVAGVPFALAELNNNPVSTGVIQTPSSPNGGFPTGVAGPFDYRLTMPAGTQATALYSLANSAWGAAGLTEGSIVVTGTGGETATLSLVEGVNIRDHNNDGFVNTLSDLTVVSTYFLDGSPTTPDISDQTRLDRQMLILPDSFAGDTIATIDFEGYANGYPDGSAFLAGLTLSDVSVPDGPLPLPFLVTVFVAMLAAAGISQKAARRPSHG